MLLPFNLAGGLWHGHAAGAGGAAARGAGHHLQVLPVGWAPHNTRPGGHQFIEPLCILYISLSWTLSTSSACRLACPSRSARCVGIICLWVQRMLCLLIALGMQTVLLLSACSN